jgi:predicted nucleic acid-binding protein
MIFDTDILIWIQKGNLKAAKLVDRASERYLSTQSYMELLQCAKNKHQIQTMRDFLTVSGFQILPFTENIGHRAAIYMEEYTLVSGLRAGDAIIAATATENNLPLTTANVKHFKPIKDIKLKVFRP